MALVMAATLAFTAFQSHAADTPCDPQFMQAMSARAWLEAQREITQNQNLISKPDSVLEYSCFVGFLNRAAANFEIGGLNRQFSETDAWTTAGFSDTSTDDALNNVVASALINYLEGNFPDPQPYLGGRIDMDPVRPGANPVNGGEYNCTVMAEVWEKARCQNFAADRPDLDGFHDFFWYVNNDPRDLPHGLGACTADAATRTALITKYAENLDEAFNRKQDNFVIPDGEDNPPDATPYTIDDVQSYFDLILPGACANAGAYIPTGVTIRRGGAAGTPDGVCPNPGCSLVGGTCN
jgi:hypothetical protein